MKTEFILGDAAQDFESAVLEKTKNFIKDDPLNSVLIITPPQATSSIEQMLLAKLEVNGLMGVDVSTINRTVLKILAETDGKINKSLSAAGMSMAVKEILNANKEKIKSLINSKSQNDLPGMIADTIQDFKSQNITPDDLLNIETENKRIKDKLDDLALIFKDYLDKTVRYSNAEDRMKEAARLVPQSEYIKNTDVIIYGFNTFSARTIDFITALMHNAKSATVTFLNPGKEGYDKSVYDVCVKSKNILQNEAEKDIEITNLENAPRNKSEYIIYTANNLFSRKKTSNKVERRSVKNGGNYPIKISYAADMKTEIDGVIAQIVKLNQDKRIPYYKIALVCGNAPQYLPAIKNRFKNAGVPCFTGDKRSLAASNIASFILTAFKLSKGRLSKTLILEHAASGFTELEDSERYEIENYAYQKISGGYAFFKDFTYADTDLENERLNEIRRKLVEPVYELRKRVARAKTIGQWIASVEKYLKELNLSDKIEKIINEMTEAGSLKEADYHEQAYKRIFEILEEAKEICGDAPADMDFTGVLEAGFKAEEIAVIPQAVDEVICGDIYKMYIPEVTALFILGVNTGVIPDYKSETNILTDEEQDLIFRLKPDLKPAGRTELRKLSILKAFALPTDYLYLSYLENAESNPSLLIDRVIDLNKGIQKPQDLERIVPSVEKNALDYTARRLRNIADGLPVDNYGEAYEQTVYSDQRFAKYLDDLKRIKNPAEYDIKIDEKTAGDLYGKQPMAATRTETFYACPYRYFLRYGLKIDKMREAEVSTLNKGNFAHKMLENITNSVKRGDKDWTELTDGEFENILDKSQQETIQSVKEYEYSAQNAVILDGITNAVKAAARQVRNFATSGSLKPAIAEKVFKRETGFYDLTGKIDRIDAADIDGQKYYGIVDYKTSDRDFNIDKFFGGIDIQVIFYLMAVERLLGEEYLPAGAAYMKVEFPWLKNGKEEKNAMKGLMFTNEDLSKILYGDGRKLTSMTGGNRYYTSEEARLMIGYLKKLIDDANEKIASGDISVAPSVYEGNKCDYCDYNSICFKDKDDKTGDRVIEKLSKEAVLRKIADELGEENGTD